MFNTHNNSTSFFFSFFPQKSNAMEQQQQQQQQQQQPPFNIRPIKAQATSSGDAAMFTPTSDTSVRVRSIIASEFALEINRKQRELAEINSLIDSATSLLSLVRSAVISNHVRLTAPPSPPLAALKAQYERELTIQELMPRKRILKSSSVPNGLDGKTVCWWCGTECLKKIRGGEEVDSDDDEGSGGSGDGGIDGWVAMSGEGFANDIQSGGSDGGSGGGMMTAVNPYQTVTIKVCNLCKTGIIEPASTHIYAPIGINSSNNTNAMNIDGQQQQSAMEVVKTTGPIDAKMARNIVRLSREQSQTLPSHSVANALELLQSFGSSVSGTVTRPAILLLYRLAGLFVKDLVKAATDAATRQPRKERVMVVTPWHVFQGMLKLNEGKDGGMNVVLDFLLGIKRERERQMQKLEQEHRDKQQSQQPNTNDNNNNDTTINSDRDNESSSDGDSDSDAMDIDE
ncbi:hypothetical protein GQ42DRAFT_50210 [Ramicandelaber brevisporus]|nr:hypothetical protein GQ42DRAFT_50210 [Ramicandelaber brevisporus]